jgi:hypothetical protein
MAEEYPTQEHAVAALARAANAKPSEAAEIRRAVREQYPDLPSSQGDGMSAAAQATRRSGRRT